MSLDEEREAKLKVCRTCRHWSEKHKGLCTRSGHAAGQFWMCEEWTELPDNAAEPQGKNAPGSRPA